MDFLTLLKSNISAKTLENLSTFLGEKINDVDSSFGLSVNSFMAGLFKYAHSDIEVKNILNVLNDGGHTGDILNNLESFSENFEKTQLLVTIGNNIVTHFLGNKAPIIVDKISGISEIKKTSSTSLLSLSAPIVLGFIGKHVKERNLDTAGLRNYFKEINPSVINSLPPAVSNIFQFKKITNDLKEQKVVTEKIVNKNKKSTTIKWGTILPWVFLVLAGLGVLYYAKFRKPKNETANEVTIVKEKEVELIPEDFLPDSSITNLPTETNVVPVKPSDEKEVLKEELETGKNNVEKKNKIEEKTNQKPIEKPKTENSPLKNIASDKKEGLSKIKPSEIDKNNKKEEIPSGWNGINGNSFKKNSAELSSSGGITSIFNSLKNNSKNLKISPLSDGNRTLSEDRAYAIKDALIEKGIDPERIEIGSTQKGGNQNGIVYRIIN